MTKIDRLVERLGHLETEYRSLLIQALRDCASGRWGLLGHNEHQWAQSPDVVDELVQLAASIDIMRQKLGQQPYPLHQQFQQRRGRVDANSVGEPKQAQEWLRALGEG